MPTIGWFEILIIVAIAIVVLGPKDFPIMLKKVGSWIGSAKRYFSDVQNQVTEITDVSIKEELKKNTEITHLSLFDNYIEGIRLKKKPVFSVQYHPEANPGPQDSKYLFNYFIKDVKKYAKKKRH